MKAFEVEAKIILCDIEGTTTSINFVKDILFTYAKDNIETFLTNKWKDSEICSIIHELQQLPEFSTFKNEKQFEEPTLCVMVCFIKDLIDKDLKITVLKLLQGIMWEIGYSQGILKTHIYDDVRPAFEKWIRNKHSISIFSSGSVQAQKLLYKHSIQGDLTEFISSYFDTEIGNKRDPKAYANISKKLEVESKEILFLTDVGAEAEAAKQSGMKAIILYRPGNTLSEDEKHQNIVVQNFEEINLKYPSGST